MRLAWFAPLLPLALTAASCMSDGSGILPNGRIQGSSPARTDAPDASSGKSGNGNGDVPGTVARESPAADRKTPTPSPSVSPTAFLEPTPSPTAYVPFSTKVTVLPATASINLPAPDAADGAGYPTSVLLRAEVRFSTVPVSTSSDVLWRSDDPLVAQVAANGLVTAASTAGEVVVWAVARDNRASGSCRVIVTSHSALGLTIR